MKPKFILPASLALTVHAFLLFGLPGKPLVLVSPDKTEPKPPEGPVIPLDPAELARVVGEESDPGAESKQSENPAPRPLDIPFRDPRPDDFVISPLPPVRRGTGIDRIPSDWVSQRDPIGNVGTRVVSWTDLDRVPRARLQPAPVYPNEMRGAGMEGTVVVEFMVDEAGNAYNPSVLSATVRGFEEAALGAVARWKFEPGLKDRRRVRFRMSVPVVFRLNRE
jgi:protein TonB